MEREIIYLSPGELIQYKNNARVHGEEQLGRLRASIREFGMVKPVLIDQNKQILAGHGIVEAAKLEGLDQIPCILVSNLSEEQKRAYILADNKLAELSRWDFGLLEQELSELNIDMSQFGFQQFDLSDLEISDEDFISDTEITKKKEKKVVCPHCGQEFEL